MQTYWGKLFQCSVCQKTFAESGHLTVYKHIYTDENHSITPFVKKTLFNLVNELYMNMVILVKIHSNAAFVKRHLLNLII